MIKIKLTHYELEKVYESIYPDFKGLRELMEQKQYREAIVFFTMNEIRVLLRKRLATAKQKSILNLTHSQACWLISYYQWWEYDPALNPYLDVLFKRIMGEIDKQLTNYQITLRK